MTSSPATSRRRVALVTGASQGLGLALAHALAAAGWCLVIDARHPDALRAAVRTLVGEPSGGADRDAPHGPSADGGSGEAEPPRGGTRIRAIPGDVADPAHRAELVAAVAEAGRLDLLVHNASELGPSPLPSLAEHPLDDLERVYQVDVLAPLALTQLVLPHLRSSRGALVAVSSDAAVEAYAGWGGYGSAKAALDHLVAVLAVENPDLRIYSIDPGDMNTAMHQRAFPGKDISDRPGPETVVPALLRLARENLPSGRYRAADLLSAEVGA
jgi:NAD(P)-dependent dehydrogenase (short-subunit alcohol dehydrogenase family)